MSEIKIENYIENEEETSQGHVDVRHENFKCENFDKNLGCDLGIDVAG